MYEPYARVLEERIDGGRYRLGPHSVGPWHADLAHGGPPAALLVRAAERLAGAGGGDLVAMRVSAEFVGPVPVGDVVVAARTLRAARSATLVEATLTARERTCLSGRVWLVRAADTGALAPPLPQLRPVPDGPGGIGADFPYSRTIEWRVISGGMGTPGPGVTWACPLHPLVHGERLTGLQRAALLGDSASGLSSELDWARWSFVNLDLDVHLSRPVDGDWLLLDAVTSLGSHGAALARSTVSDRRGPVGCTAQTLVLAAR